MKEPTQSISNSSKELSHADDSAAALLVEILKGTPGRNFDVESIFVERLDSGNWRWIIYEFLKADTVSPTVSHPNYYWRKNKRKFLSLWALVTTLRKAGYYADLILVNYADDRTKDIKEMQVVDIRTNPTKIFRAAYERNGIKHPELKEYIETTDTIMSFEKWKQKFRDFNDKKNGDTWELLEATQGEPPSLTLTPPSELESLTTPTKSICGRCKKPFVPRTNGALLCIDCWKATR